jgi:glutathione S-transferase
MVDSTPIIQRLELEYAERRVVPTDPLLGFLDLLIEDFADEWLTKAMFHYRWHYAADAAHAGPLLAFWQDLQLDTERAKQSSQAFADRQISRLYVVGSSDLTAPVIESSYQRLVGIMDRIVQRRGFVMGSRPGASDFALYGQLTQLVLVDPTPAQYAAQHSLRLRAWIDRMDDLSGHTHDQWLSASDIQSHLGELLNEVGRVYAPFLMANAKAVANGQADFETTIDGKKWSQPVFPYQAKCLETLRQAHAKLTSDVKQKLNDILSGTGCEILFDTTKKDQS